MSYRKQIFKINVLKRFINNEKSCVSLVPTTRLLALPPFFLNDMKSGILYILNSMLKKYDRSLGGIVIGYQNIKVLLDENTGIIPIGTSETEVNISVEFYIFQPKIGNYLEGVINKKSNNHIGCLVHQYFNATILKSEDVEYNDWLCKDFNVDDKIIFRVKDLDFTSVLPYIEGVIDEKTLFNKVKIKFNKNCDMNNVIMSNVKNDSLNKDLIPGESLKKEEYKNESFNQLGTNVNTISEENNSFINHTDKKAKKKKKKIKLIDDDIKIVDYDYDKGEQEKCSNDEVTSETISLKSKLGESYFENKKEKKKKKKTYDKGNVQEIYTAAPKEETERLTSSILENYPSRIEDENSSDFVKTIKSKKNKKKKKEKTEEEEPFASQEETERLTSSILENYPSRIEDENSSDFVKTIKSKKNKKRKKEETEEEEPFASQCLSSVEPEDNVFYSTLIEPLSSKKIRVPFFSPIAKGLSLDAKKDEKSLTMQDTDTSMHSNSQDIKVKKKKHKKWKRKEEEEEEEEEEEGKEDVSASTKKISIDFSSKKETFEKNKLEMERMMEELYEQQLNRVKEELNMSAEETFKESNRKKEKKPEVKRESLSKTTKTQINSALETAEHVQEFLTMKEKAIMTDRESSKESKKKKKKTSKAKEEIKSMKALVNGLNGTEKSEPQNTVDELLQLELNKMKEELKMSGPEEKKKMTDKPKTSHYSLYDKLLEQAKSIIDLKENNSPSEKRKKKPDDFLQLSSSSKKKRIQKKQNTENCHQTADNYKNGSMYDIIDTPEKVNFDKSLFTDSENSHTSPVKRKRIMKVNGIEQESLLQIAVNDFSKEKSESDKESLKKKEKKRKSKLASQDPGKPEESLYEKLLKEAKSLIESPPKKKKS